jgi:hypothetical protein
MLATFRANGPAAVAGDTSPSVNRLDARSMSN